MAGENKHSASIFLLVLASVFSLALFICLTATFMVAHPVIGFIAVFVVPILLVTGIFLLVLRATRHSREKSS